MGKKKKRRGKKDKERCLSKFKKKNSLKLTAKKSKVKKS